MSNLRYLPFLRSTLGTVFIILILGISSQVVHIDDAEARRGGRSGPRHAGRGGVRRGGRRTVRRAHRRDHRRDHYRDHHRPHVGAAIVAGVVIGSVIASLPRNCSSIYINGVTYHECGNAYYKPYYQGGSVTYVVVNSPY